MNRTALTIAGSDCSGGAGVQADIKTMTAYGVYGMSAVTALTVQNTLGVTAIQETGPDILKGQLEAVFSDIAPDAVKIGMIPSAAQALVVAETLERYRPRHVVVDPVMISTSGRRLMAKEAARVVTDRILPLAEVVTPNIPEAEYLLDGRKICDTSDMESAAVELGSRYRTAVLVKGGHLSSEGFESADEMGCGADDCLFDGSAVIWLCGKRLDGKNTHGTGCTLSSAVACGLALGWPLELAAGRAKRFLTESLKSEPGLGHGNGPLNHCFAIESTAWWERYG